MGLLVTPGYINSDLILDGSIVNADVSASAAIEISKLATSTSFQLASIISDETGTGVLVFGTSPSFTTDIRTPKITTNGATNLILDTNTGTGSGSITINSGANGNIAITPNGSGAVDIGNTSNSGIISTGSATANLTLNTNGGTTSGSIVITAGASGNITIAPNGSGSLVIGTLNGLLKGTTGVVSAATAGTDYLAPFGSQTANTVYAAPNGSAGAPTFRALVANDIPGTLNATTINGNLVVNGTTTTINSNTVAVDDKNLELGSVTAVTGLSGTLGTGTSATITGLTTTVGLIPGMALTKTAGTGTFGATPIIQSVDSLTQITVFSSGSNPGSITFDAAGASDSTANGGGITLLGSTDKTITWDSTNSNWTSSENWNIASSKTFKINNVTVLNTSQVLGSATGVTVGGSSTTSVALGTNASALNTVTVGGAVTGNTLKIASTAAGTINLTTDVTTGNANIFNSMTTGLISIGSANAGRVAVSFNTTSSSTSTGALTVGGGAGIVGALNVGGTGSIGLTSANYFTIAGAAAASTPTISSTGSDTNVGFNVQTKGTGSFTISSTTTNTTSNITASGANANINLVLAGKGTGTVNINTLVINTSGTITTGTWNGTAIGVAYGGTGQTTYTDGQLLIGNTSGNTLTKATLTQGTGITITNGNGSITVANAGVTSVNGGTGAISNVALTTGTLAQFAATTSAQLAGVISDETGSGALVFGTSPSFTTDIRTPKVTTASAVNLVLDTNTGTNSGNITITQGVNGNIALTPNGSGVVNIGNTASSGVVTTGSATANLVLSTNNGTTSGSITITAGVNGNISITPNGTGNVNLGDITAAGLVTTGAATANLTLNTNSGTNSGSIVITAGVNGNITITPNGTGVTDLGDVARVKITGGSLGNVLTTNGSGVLSWTAVSSGAGTVNSGTANQIAYYAANGTAVSGLASLTWSSNTLTVGTAATATTITTNGTGNLTLSTNAGTNSGTIVINQGASGNINITPNGSGLVNIGNTASSGLVTTGSLTSNLVLNTNNGTTTGSITINAGANQNITLTANGSGNIVANTLTISSTGVVTSGTWNGTAVGVAYGGTGQTTYTNGQLLIGNTTGNTLTKATLTQGTGITITNGTGSITIANASPMTYPGSGIANSTGSAWGTSYSTTGSGTVVALQTTPSFTTSILTPKVSTSGATNLVLDTNSGTTTGSITINTGANGNIAITPNGTGVVNIGNTSNAGSLTTGSATANLTLNTNSGTNSGSIVITAGVNGNISITPNGTGNINLGDTSLSGLLTTGSLTANLVLNTNNGTTSGSITITAGANGNITITPNGTGVTDLGDVARVKITGGSLNQVLTTNGSGVLSWSTVSAGGSGTVNSGTANQIAYYAANGTAVSGLASLTWSSNTLQVGSAANTTLNVQGSAAGGTATITSNVTTGAVSLMTSLTTGTMTIGSAAAGRVAVAFNQATTSKTTGSLVVTGGIGSSGKIYADNLQLYNSGGTAITLGDSSLSSPTSATVDFCVGTTGTPGRIQYQSGTGFEILSNTLNTSINFSTSSSNFNGTKLSISGSSGDVKVWSGTASTSTTTGALTVVGGVGIGGALNATTKSFIIPHPTKTGKLLRHGSLEGPEFGVYVRGKLTNSRIIELPEYWTNLVDPESITVDLTPVGKFQKLYVEKIENNKIYIDNDSMFGGNVSCFYTVWATRRDVDPLEVEGDE